MKTKILIGFICLLGIFSANAQTITAPVGQSLTVTNPIDVTVAGGSVNVPSDGSYNFGTTKIISIKGTNNLFVGANAGSLNTAVNNVFVGGGAGQNNSSGPGNLFFGPYAGFNNSTGPFNTFMGISAGEGNTSGGYNLFIGGGAGFANTTGQFNLFLGTNSGRGNGVGNSNIFMGFNSGFYSSGVDGNSFVGSWSGYNNTSGASNSGIGQNAGYSNTNGSLNTFLGSFADIGAVSPAGITNATAIGANAKIVTSNTVVLGNATTTVTGAGLALHNSGLKFATLTSASPAVSSSGTAGKVLSVNASGEVILVQITGTGVSTQATNPVAENWKESEGYLYNNSTNGVVIKGTGLDGNALIVKGGVLSTEVNVKVEGSETWPDYVFKPTYKRMSLGEVGKFIAINGHLPNVPSATEMAISGNNLGKTDVKLLEKVEELTLYLLDMKKVNDAQAAELKSLKKQVSKLRKK